MFLWKIIEAIEKQKLKLNKWKREYSLKIYMLKLTNQKTSWNIKRKQVTRNSSKIIYRLAKTKKQHVVKPIRRDEIWWIKQRYEKSWKFIWWKI